jgi:UDP-N-acetylmuramoylalanine--D-glutamate ligase
MRRVAVLGLALTGEAVARALHQRGIELVLADDAPTQAHTDLAASLGASLVDVSNATGIDRFLNGVDTLLPAPGVPPHNPVVVRAGELNVVVRSEIDIAYEWEQHNTGGPRPILGVTGTDGKTTTTMLAAHILRTAGMKVEEVGNTDTPFVAAVAGDADAFVVECSSFRLHYAQEFRCDASVWLNIAPDHLDWHSSFENYAADKARMWSHSRATDVAIAQAGNNLIVDAARRSGCNVVTFGLHSGDYRCDGGVLVGPNGPIVRADEMWRSMPHDITNSLAAAAMVLERKLATTDVVAQGLRTFTPAHHRIEFVAEHNGVRWFDDSKATSPHAALTAIRAFERLVLIAGGRNKDLDLNELATEPQRMAGVVAIGESSQLIVNAFTGVAPVVIGDSMQDAISKAASMASHGDCVVLSPGCTSYDWYRNYGERGDDFQSRVRAFVEQQKKGQG